MTTLGDLFDGIGGFPFAATIAGIKPIWAAEIDPACVAVTRQHFPDMLHYGDVSKINGAEIPHRKKEMPKNTSSNKSVPGDIEIIMQAIKEA